MHTVGDQQDPVDVMRCKVVTIILNRRSRRTVTIQVSDVRDHGIRGGFGGVRTPSLFRKLIGNLINKTVRG